MGKREREEKRICDFKAAPLTFRHLLTGTDKPKTNTSKPIPTNMSEESYRRRFGNQAPKWALRMAQENPDRFETLIAMGRRSWDRVIRSNHVIIPKYQFEEMRKA